MRSRIWGFVVLREFILFESSQKSTPFSERELDFGLKIHGISLNGVIFNGVWKYGKGGERVALGVTPGTKVCKRVALGAVAPRGSQGVQGAATPALGYPLQRMLTTGPSKWSAELILGATCTVSQSPRLTAWLFAQSQSGYSDSQSQL